MVDRKTESRRQVFARGRLWLTCLAALLMGSAGSLRAQQDAIASDSNDIPEMHLSILRKAGISTSPEGLRQYLINVRPSVNHRKLARRYIEELGADDWRVRERATHALISMPVVPHGLLKEAAEGKDPELSVRAHRVLAQRGDGFALALQAVFRAIEVRGYHSCLDAILATLPLCEKSYVSQAAGETLSAIVKPGDVDVLLKAMKDAPTDRQALLIGPLASALGPQRSGRLRPWMKQGPLKVRLRAAIAMLNLKDRDGLKGLVELLGARDARIRSQAVSALRGATGEYMEFAPGGDSDRRRAAQQKWSRWVDEKGGSADLRLPVRAGWGCRGELGGNYLVAYGYKHKVEEIDPKGRVVWSYKIKGPWSAEKLPNGNVLIAAYSENKLVVVNAKSELVWEFSINCLNAELLPNGNFLVADYSGNRVVEINRQKKVVWSRKAGGSCADAERLANGNTLVAAGSSVSEITPSGEVAWKHDWGTAVYSVQQLSNGNLLVALLSHNRVEEITRKKEVVWKHSVPSPSDAFRLPNGNTLITGNSVAYEVTSDGKEIWSHDGMSYGTVRK